ncbi:MAG: M56 family metallopeptidase, partial [Gemmatimonadaceae bacterium]
MNTAFVDAFARLASVFPPTHPVVLTVLKVTLVLLLAWAATAALERASAGSRHLVWLITLGALLVVPAVAVWAPWPLRVLPAGASASSGHPDDVLNGAPPSRTPDGQAPSRSVETSAPGAVVPGGAASRAPGAGAPARGLSVGAVLLLAWSVVALALLARLAHGAYAVRRVVKHARPLVDAAWQTPLYEIGDRLGLDVVPTLLQSSDVKMPFAAGLWRTTIVLPQESEAWSAERRSAVLIHELGHVRRRDLVGHTLSRIACALYWFHPLVWTAARRLRAESERACDDLALVFGARPSDYAEHLLDIVTCVRDHNTPAIALAMAHRREFEGRMLAILNPDLSRSAPSRMQRATMITTLAGFALLLGAASPVPRAAAEPSGQAKPSAQAAPSAQAGPQPRPVMRSALPATGLPAAAMAAPSRAADGAQSSDDRIDALAKALRTDANSAVRRTAAWGLQRFAHDEAAESALVAALSGDSDSEVREMAAWSLHNARPGTAAGQAIVRAIRQDKDASVVRTAVWVAGNMGDRSTVDALVTALGNGDANVREVAAWSIGQCDPGAAPAGLVKALGDAEAKVRLSASWALYNIADESTAGAIEAAFRKETDAQVQMGLLRALGSLGDASVPILERLVSSP